MTVLVATKPGLELYEIELKEGHKDGAQVGCEVHLRTQQHARYMNSQEYQALTDTFAPKKMCVHVHALLHEQRL